ncbi:heme o synthase [Thalassobaculum litoreum]|uniref:Protoheme IX farnesyltransferase n=1 Tax=Thalassobaculum litoreum DSM 18839 TaxID=1123362 RepID=A0A8G2BHP5_9PROT|nr:protoheme IX farnesyltransferase [Thalassobaculum litoreum DSM 18839]
MTDLTAQTLSAEAVPSTGTASVRDYIALLKPRVMSLVVFTGFVGLAIAPGDIHPVLATIAVLCIAVGAGASGAINMWYDRDIDAVMGRTDKRPIPAGKVDADEALSFGVILAGFSVLVMALAVNVLSAALLAATIGFYVFVYTMWLKRRTPQNIVIGGAAGAVPPVIGWAAATGDVSWLSLVMFAIIFVWTPPHFWALALWKRGEYAAAGVPMLPVVSGERSTKRQILAYSVLLAVLGLAPWAMAATTAVYGVASIVLGGLFVLGAVQVLRAGADDMKPAKLLFGYSILYLFALFGALLADHWIAG